MKFFYVLRDSCFDALVRQICKSSHNMQYGLALYNIVTYNTVDIIITLLALKLTVVDKIVLSLIIAFII